LTKQGKIVLYRAIETDFDTINSTLADLKQQTKKTLKKYQQNEEKIVAGNWKMHKNAEQTEDLLNELIAKIPTETNAQVIVAPTFVI
jgi:hypothetical protein